MSRNILAFINFVRNKTRGTLHTNELQRISIRCKVPEVLFPDYQYALHRCKVFLQSFYSCFGNLGSHFIGAQANTTRKI